jgi:hypothetical protein
MDNPLKLNSCFSFMPFFLRKSRQSNISSKYNLIKHTTTSTSYNNCIAFELWLDPGPISIFPEGLAVTIPYLRNFRSAIFAILLLEMHPGVNGGS